MMWLITGLAELVLGTKIAYEAIRFDLSLALIAGCAFTWIGAYCIGRYFDGADDVR